MVPATVRIPIFAETAVTETALKRHEIGAFKDSDLPSTAMVPIARDNFFANNPRCGVVL